MRFRDLEKGIVFRIIFIEDGERIEKLGIVTSGIKTPLPISMAYFDVVLMNPDYSGPTSWSMAKATMRHSVKRVKKKEVINQVEQAAMLFSL